MLHDCPSMHKWHRDVPRNARVPLVFGFGLLLAVQRYPSDVLADAEHQAREEFAHAANG